MKLETIRLGRIVNAHGIRGEVRVQPEVADPALLTRFKVFYIGGQRVVPTANHVHKGVVLMKFPGVDDMNAALALKGKFLDIRREDAHLKPDEFFDQELLGVEVFDCVSGARLGEVTAVENYPAHQVYTVKGEKEYLIPAVKGAFIESVDIDANRMEVHVWEGMESDAD